MQEEPRHARRNRKTPPGQRDQGQRVIASRSADGLRRAYVVTDVGELTAQQFQDARRICKDSGIELAISNPCLEVWLVDHLARCPDSHSETRGVERRAADLGIVGGSGNKHVDYDRIGGICTSLSTDGSQSAPLIPSVSLAVNARSHLP